MCCETFNSLDIPAGKEIDLIRSLKTGLANLLKKNLSAEEIIIEPIKEESQKCRVEIEEFVDNLKSFLNNLK